MQQHTLLFVVLREPKLSEVCKRSTYAPPDMTRGSPSPSFTYRKSIEEFTRTRIGQIAGPFDVLKPVVGWSMR